MSYFAPYVDAAGAHFPVYDDVYSYLIQGYLTIFGQNNSTNPALPDIQEIANRALLIMDCMNAAQLAVAARSPLTAIGTDLDDILPYNGITRKSASYSVATLLVVGIAGTPITNGLVQDVNNNTWSLPSSVIIPPTGSINVTGTCTTIGAIQAPANTINKIKQPVTAGWTSVNNPTAASPGLPVETDSQARGRQAVSTTYVAKTMVTSTLAAIAAVPNVTRYATGISIPGNPGTSVENPTGSTDSWGNPPHSISMVVEGGADLDVATAIYNNKTPGCLTNGSTGISVTDPTTAATMVISFSRPTYTQIYVSMNVHPLTGYTSAVTTAIQTAVVNYLNSLQIGELVTISGLYAAAMSVMPNILIPQYSIKALTTGTSASPTGTVDIAIAWNAVAQSAAAKVVITLV